MKDSGFLKMLFIVLLGALVLQSCDMSKYYFRMHPGGKGHQPRNIAHEESVSPSFSVSEEKAPVRIDRDTVFENAQTDSPISPNSVSERVVPKTTVHEKMETTQLESRNESKEQASSDRIKNKHHVRLWRDQKKASQLSEGEEFVLALYGIAMLIILGIGIIVFFISLIFAPAMLSLKIALWTMLGLSIYPTIVAIILFRI